VVGREEEVVEGKDRVEGRRPKTLVRFPGIRRQVLLGGQRAGDQAIERSIGQDSQERAGRPLRGGTGTEVETQVLELSSTGRRESQD
jgi:hypothetical protein